MRIKTFYTKTMSEALRQIKSHMGPEALLLSTREIPRRSGAWGNSSGFEVVAAVDNPEDIDTFSASSREQANAVEDHPRHESPKPLLEEVTLETYSPAGLIRNSGSPKARRERRAAITEADLETAGAAAPALPFKGRIPAGLYQDFVKHGVDEGLARELLSAALDSLSAGQRRSRPALVRSVTRAALARLAEPTGEHGMPGKRVVAFVGPTGMGKTTSIAKLAAQLALQRKKKVILMTLDGYRIGAVEQLRSYAGLMGIPFRFVDQIPELPRAIEENSQRDYVLIDTAGHGPKDMGSMAALASFLKESDFIERHLVLSAATKTSDMREAMDRFEICLPDHLLFTKLDETSTPGPILNELIRTGKSFSYYSSGQRVPDDLHAVPRDRIIDIVLNQIETN